MAVVLFVGDTFEEFLVVSTFVFFGETGGEAEIGEFDVAFCIDEDVVGFDVTEIVIRYGGKRRKVTKLMRQEEGNTSQAADDEGIVTR